MAEEQAAHHLLNVLEERGLDVDLDRILIAFEDEDTKQDAAAWVEEYLQEDTLLTREELDLYKSLKRKGLLHQYEFEGEPVRPVLDREIASAVESLQSSAAAIEAQCKVLEAQKDALMKIKTLDKPNLAAEHARNEKRRKEGQEKARLDVAVDDVITALVEQIMESQKELDIEKSDIKSYLSERLVSDDQILGRLPSIVSKLTTEIEVSEEEKSIDQWCNAIIMFRTGEIKAKVDTVYLKSLAGSSPSVKTNESDEELKERKTALQTELEELHAEIASVAEMVVEHELRKPMKEMRDRKARNTEQARGAWLHYILSTLEFMRKRLDTVAIRTEDVDQYQQALTHISEAAFKRMPGSHEGRPTPPRRRTLSNTSAFTPMVKLKPTKTLDLPAALQDALRHAGIPFNQDSFEALQDSLIHAHLTQEKKLRDQFESTSTSTHERLAERSNTADKDLSILLDALYKYTPFQQVSLINPSLDQLLNSMEGEIEAKNHELSEAERNELNLSDARVEAFIAKYGR